MQSSLLPPFNIMLPLTHLKILSTLADSKILFGCDNLNFNLNKCNNSYPIICVSEASFERVGKNTCSNNQNGMENTTCTYDDVLTYMRDMCHGNRSCEFTLSSKAMGNHCEGAFKYITVIINCGKSIMPILYYRSMTI